MKKTVVRIASILLFAFMGTGLFAQAQHRELGTRVFGDTEESRKLYFGAVPVRSQFISGGRSYIEFEDGSILALLREIDRSPVPCTAEEIKKRDEFLRQLPPKSTLPDKYSLWPIQTPIKAQGSRGTCYVFAPIAAIEACYNRNALLAGRPKPNLDLSEQYAIQINKTTLYIQTDPPSADLLKENVGSYMDWDGGSEKAVLKGLKSYYIPVEDNQPHGYWTGGIENSGQWVDTLVIGNGTTYRTRPEMDHIFREIPSIPHSPPIIGLYDSFPGFNQIPKKDLATQAQLDDFEYSPTYMPWQSHLNCKYSVKDYINWGKPSTDDIESILHCDMEVIAGVGHMKKIQMEIDGNIVGVWDYDPVDTEWNSSGHVWLIVGYDRNYHVFYVKNSNGGSSLSIMTYNLWNQLLSTNSIFQSALSVVDVPDLNISPQVSANWLGHWYMDHDGYFGELIIRRLPDSSNAPVKLGSYIDYFSGRTYDVNGRLEEGGRGLIYYVADTTDPVPFGKETGQRFEAYDFSTEPNLAAGATTYNNMPFGVFLSRNPIQGIWNSPFDKKLWLGTWNMNHDGWHGRLQIDYLQPWGGGAVLTGFYEDLDNGGVAYYVRGILDASCPWHFSFTIHYPGHDQPFDLYFHTWESNIFSGTTVWNGITFGVLGIKNRASSPAPWQVNHRYLVGDKVTYKGAIYQCTFEHVSLPGWEPDNPVMWAVWKKIS